MPRFRRVGELAMVVPRPGNTRQGGALRPLKDGAPPRQPQSREWQEEAYRYNTEIGEIGYLHSLKANTFAACDLRPVEVDGDERVETEDERAHRVLKSFVGPRGGLKELMRRAELNYSIAGEVTLIGTPAETVEEGNEDDTGMLWEFVSVLELKDNAATGQGVQRNLDGTWRGTVDLDPDTTVIARWYRSDPAHSALADSAMRRALPICRQLVLLAQALEAAASSRISADMMLVPDGMSFSGAEPNEDADPDGEIDPFVEALFEHMTAPLEDRKSASSLVPPVIRGDKEDIAAMKMLGIGRDLGTWALALQREAFTRLFRTLDAPPEIAQGKAALNHWTGYSVDQEFASKHIIPDGESFAEWLTVAYYRPMLVAYEGMTEEEADRHFLEFDASNITARADAGLTAIQLWKERLITSAAVVRATGFDDADMPTPEEWAEQLLRDAVTENPSLIATYSRYIPALKKLIDSAPKTALPGGKGEQPALPADATKPEALNPARPKEVPPASGPKPSDPQAGGGEPDTRRAAARQIAVIGDRHLLRGIERAGASRFRPGALIETLDDQWDDAVTEARQVILDVLVGELGQNPVPVWIEAGMAALRSGLTLVAETTRGAEVYDNGLRVPDELAHAVLEVSFDGP